MAGPKMVKAAQRAHLGVAVLTPHFVAKMWPMKELQLMLSDMVRTSEGRFLPLFYKVRSQSIAPISPTCSEPASCKGRAGPTCRSARTTARTLIGHCAAMLPNSRCRLAQSLLRDVAYAGQCR